MRAPSVSHARPMCVPCAPHACPMRAPCVQLVFQAEWQVPLVPLVLAVTGLDLLCTDSTPSLPSQPPPQLPLAPPLAPPDPSSPPPNAPRPPNLPPPQYPGVCMGAWTAWAHMLHERMGCMGAWVHGWHGLSVHLSHYHRFIPADAPPPTPPTGACLAEDGCDGSFTNASNNGSWGTCVASLTSMVGDIIGDYKR